MTISVSNSQESTQPLRWGRCSLDGSQRESSETVGQIVVGPFALHCVDYVLKILRMVFKHVINSGVWKENVAVSELSQYRVVADRTRTEWSPRSIHVWLEQHIDHNCFRFSKQYRKIVRCTREYRNRNPLPYVNSMKKSAGVPPLVPLASSHYCQNGWNLL